MTRKPTYDELAQRIRSLERRIDALTAAAAPVASGPSPALADIDSATALQDFIDAIPAIALLATVDGTVVAMNRTLETRLGKTRQAVVGRSILAMIPKKDASRFEEQKRAAIQSGRPVQFERQREDECVLYFICPIHNIHDQVGLLAVIGIDISHQRRVEKALKESESRFRTLFEEAPIAIQGYAPDGTVCYWNKANQAVYGYTREEALGRNLIHLIIPPEMRDAVAAAIRHGAETGRMPASEELMLMRKDGSRVPVYSSHVVFKSNPRTAELYCLDIDLTRLRRVQEQLEQKYRLESIGTLAEGIADDFNTMLDIIIANTELARDQISPKNPASRFLRDISDAGRQAKEIVRQLHRFSRTDSHLAPIDIVQVIADTLKLLRVTLPATIDIRQQLTATPSWALADPNQIRHLLITLFSNAADTMEQTGGTILIRVDHTHLRASDHAFPELDAGEYIDIIITDSGPGFPSETIDRLFDPYVATPSGGRRTGIGLSAVKGIITAHNGGISVDSGVGRGTRFRLLVPKFDGGDPQTTAG